MERNISNIIKKGKIYILGIFMSLQKHQMTPVHFPKKIPGKPYIKPSRPSLGTFDFENPEDNHNPPSPYLTNIFIMKRYFSDLAIIKKSTVQLNYSELWS